MDMRLELVPLPTTDVDASLAFYTEGMGFVLDHDVEPGNGMRDAPRVQNLHLVVDDIDEAREMLTGNGVDVSEVQDMGGVKYAHLSDPDGNTWALQQLSR